MEFCPKCGSVLHESRATCYYCEKGKSAKLSRRVREYQRGLRKTHRVIFGLVILFIALSVGFSAYWFLELLRHK